MLLLLLLLLLLLPPSLLTLFTSEDESYRTQLCERGIRSLQSNLTLEEIQEKDAKLRKEVTEMEEKLIKLRKGVTLVRPEDKKAIEDMYSDKITQWRKRKRMFKDVWDTVTENFPRDNKELKEELVIEYDEEKKDGLCSR